MLHRVCAVTVAALLLFASIVPVAAAATLQPNNFLGLRAAAADSVSAVCSLGAARPEGGSVSVWVGVGGTAFLDIVQVGIVARPRGTRFFAAHGRGSPNGPNSLYVEHDLGPADALPHSLRAALARGTWSFAIDGRVRLTVPDGFRTWPLRTVQVMHETEAATDQMGGTPTNPALCRRARWGNGSPRPGQWQFGGYGSTAASVMCVAGSDWFAAWRP